MVPKLFVITLPSTKCLCCVKSPTLGASRVLDLSQGTRLTTVLFTVGLNIFSRVNELWTSRLMPLCSPIRSRKQADAYILQGLGLGPTRNSLL